MGVLRGGGSVGCGIEGYLLDFIPLISLLPVSYEVSSFTSIHASCHLFFLTLTVEPNDFELRPPVL